MRYKKYRGKTVTEALARAKIELYEENFYILEKEEIKSGFFGKNREIEITVCIMENTYPKENNEVIPDFDSESILEQARENLESGQKIAIPEPETEQITENKFTKNDSFLDDTSDEFVTENKKNSDDYTAKEKTNNLEYIKDLLRCGDFDENFINAFLNRLKENNIVNYINNKYDIINNKEFLEKFKKELFTYLKRRIYTVDAVKVERGRNKAVAFVGPTGEGKTTTLVKIAFSLMEDCRNAGIKCSMKIVTIDYFRIAAKQQLEMYSEILDKKFEYYDKIEDFRKNCDFNDKDIILVDTAGRSQRDEEEINELKKYLNQIYVDHVKCLVISATKKYYDMKDIINRFDREIGIDYIILTKLDETNAIGQALSVLVETKKPLIYFTDGQDVGLYLHQADIQGLLNINFNKMVDRFKDML